MKRHLIIAAVALFTTVSLPVSAGFNDPCTISNPCYGDYSEQEQEQNDRYEYDDYYDEERRHEETLDAIRSLRSCDDIWPIEKQVHARTYGQCQ